MIKPFRRRKISQRKHKRPSKKVKPVLDDIRTKATDAFTFLAETGKTAFQNIKTAIETNKPAIDKVIAVALDLKDKLFQAFNAAKPAITFIATTAIPAVVNAIMKIIGAAATVYQKLNQWGLLKPIIIGIAGAIAAMKMVKFAKRYNPGSNSNKSTCNRISCTEKRPCWQI